MSVIAKRKEKQKNIFNTYIPKEHWTNGETPKFVTWQNKMKIV